MQSAKELTKGSIQTMLADSALEQSKDHILQVCPDKMSPAATEAKKFVMLSDGCHEIRAICPDMEAIHEFDVVDVTKFEVESVGSEKIILVRDLKILYTGIKVRLGSPVAYNKENTFKSNISPIIPLDAKPLTSTMNGTSTTKSSYKPIKALALYEKGWTIKARLVSKGTKKQSKTGKNNYVLPLEFVDEDDVAISALICGDAVEQYDKTLKTGKVYLVSNGEVKIALKKYSSIKNDFSLMLDSKSKIEEVEDDQKIKDKSFNFTFIKDIAALPDSNVIDVLGVVTMAGSKQLHVPKKNKGAFPEVTQDNEKMFKRNIMLSDESEASISVTLWRDLAEIDLPMGTIVGLKRVKVSSYNEKQLNTAKPSEVIVNPVDKRTAVLKRLVEDKSIFANKTSLTSTSKHVITIRKLAEIERAAQKYMSDRAAYYSVVAIVSKIAADKSFYYLACKQCKRKLMEENGKYYCKKCDASTDTCNVVYMFAMRVEDGTAGMWVHVFGDIGAELMNKTAEEIKRKKDAGEDWQDLFDQQRNKARVLYKTTAI